MLRLCGWMELLTRTLQHKNRHVHNQFSSRRVNCCSQKERRAQEGDQNNVWAFPSSLLKAVSVPISAICATLNVGRGWGEKWYVEHRDINLNIKGRNGKTPAATAKKRLKCRNKYKLETDEDGKSVWVKGDSCKDFCKNQWDSVFLWCCRRSLYHSLWSLHPFKQWHMRQSEQQKSSL